MQVRSNKGAAGVDETTLRSIEEQGVTQFLEGIQADLKAYWERHGIIGELFSVVRLILLQPGDPIVMPVVFVEGQLIIDPESDQQGDGHSHGQSGDIDEGAYFAFAQVAQG
jgi:hypothetical protein